MRPMFQGDVRGYTVPPKYSLKNMVQYLHFKILEFQLLIYCPILSYMDMLLLLFLWLYEQLENILFDVKIHLNHRTQYLDGNVNQ